jgi:hypothetical protein
LHWFALGSKQQWVPEHSAARPLSSIAVSWHMHPSEIDTQMIVRHSHESAGPGQAAGAQHRSFGWPASVHGVLFGFEPSSHVHASTEVTYAP